MGIKEIISEQRDHIVFGGLLIGILEILEMLPHQKEILGFEIKYFYLGAILFTGYVFHTYHRESDIGPNINRTVSPRNLNNPKHIKNLKQQFGSQQFQHKKQGTETPKMDTTTRVEPSEAMWDQFEKG